MKNKQGSRNNKEVKIIKGIFKAISFIGRISITDLRSLYKKGLCYESVGKILHYKIKRG
jgi:hypothetical protein